MILDGETSSEETDSEGEDDDEQASEHASNNGEDSVDELVWEENNWYIFTTTVKTKTVDQRFFDVHIAINKAFRFQKKYTNNFNENNYFLIAEILQP